MKLLYANDQRGQHAPSWYTATCQIPERAALSTHASYDACIVGAGFTGLSAAIELARSGKSVVVLDAHRVGWGASGRNGGQLGSGFNQDQSELEKSLGSDVATTLWRVCEEAKQDIHDFCKQHAIDYEYRPGIVTAMHRKRFVKPLHEYCSRLQRNYGYRNLEPLSKSALHQRVASDDYHGGAVDHGAGHIHPLKLSTGMAALAEDSGVVIHELSEVVRIDPVTRDGTHRVVTPSGSIVCGDVVLATNGYLDNLHKPTNRWIMPINNFIVVTEPLGNIAEQLLPHNDAVADSRFVVNYFRRVGDNRLLFGGGENYSYRFPSSIEHSVKRAMCGVFPSLSDVAIDYSWGGTLAITRSRLPYATRDAQGIYVAGGYSGHGVALANFYGKAIAEHIDNRTERFDLLCRLPTTAFPGGAASRSTLLALAMTGFSWLDKF